MSPRSHGPVMNPPAMESTSCGVNPTPNGDGIAVPVPDNTFSSDWCRASTVRIDAAAPRNSGTSSRFAAPEYAATPTYSTTRAVATIVATSVSPPVKSKVQVRGKRPLALSAAWMKESCAASSLWIVVSICVGIVGDAKPAAVKSASRNFVRPCW